MDADDVASDKNFGMNWKMTSKTALIQLHHEIETLESINKHLVLVLQDHLMEYMQREFRFDHLENARLGNSMHIHTYELTQAKRGSFRIALASRYSTDADGIALSLGLGVSPKVELQEIIAILEQEISEDTLLRLRQ